MAYHRVCNKSNTTGATCGAGTASPFLSTWVDTLSDFWWRSCCSTFGFLCGVLYIIVWPFVLYLLVIVLSVLRLFTSSDYTFVSSKFSYIHVVFCPHRFEVKLLILLTITL
jgi:hypothetical protein